MKSVKRHLEILKPKSFTDWAIIAVAFALSVDAVSSWMGLA